MEEKENLNVINENKNPFTKILLMGKMSVGKTSIKSLIFQNKSAKDTLNLAFTNEVEESHLRFMKNISLDLLDCCSKEDFIKQYFDTKKNAIFSNVDILVFVVEAENYNHRNENDNLDDIVYFEK
jgi:Ras-related GTP-binding protein A/B